MSVTEGARLRDEGMEQVLGSTPEDYKERFRDRFAWLVSTGEIFCAEDIVAVVGKPPSPNAIGALFNGAVRRHRVEIVGYKPMADSRSHARRTPLYRAL